MSVRVSPTDKIRAEVDALFEGGIDLGSTLEQVARLGARLIIQIAVEAEVEELLGRARYQRAATTDGARAGSRNGCCSVTIKTTAGPVTIARPKLRGTTEAFASRLFGAGVTRSNALESLVIAGYVQGLSDRDVEATLADALGAEAVLSKSTVSRVCQAIKTEFAAWNERSLADVELDYLFLDGSFFKMHPGARAEPVLAAWGVTTAGEPVLIGLTPGGTESTDAWADFLTDLVRRRLRPPLLVISDAPRAARRLRAGLRPVAASEVPDPPCPQRPREGPHRAPGRGQGRLLADLRRHRRRARHPPSRTRARRVRAGPHRRLRGHGRRPLPLRGDVPAHRPRTAHQLPALPRRAPPPDPAQQLHIERTFGETRRRVKVIGRLPGETSCLSLVWAVLDRASRGWHGFTMTNEATRPLHDLRRMLLGPPTQLRPSRPENDEVTETVGAVA